MLLVVTQLQHMKNGKCTLRFIAKILVLVGALNWGLIGLGAFFGGNWNVVSMLIGSWSPLLEYVVYILVGAAAVYKLVGCKCRICKAGGAQGASGADQM